MIYEALFLNQNRRNSNFFVLAVKKSNLSAGVTACAVQLPTRTLVSNCPIKAEISAVDSQSDLRVLL